MSSAKPARSNLQNKIVANYYSKEEDRLWLEGLERRVSSASVALYTDDGHVLVVKAHYKRYWSFPGGVMDNGESPRQAAVRETLEESGIAINERDLEFCFVVERASDIARTYQFLFQAKVDKTIFNALSAQADEIEQCDVVPKALIASKDRAYSQSTLAWANGFMGGYMEQQFDAADRPETP